MALPATLVHEVRTTGSDTNGGAFDPSVASPGTDFSVQDAAQVVYTDLVIGATTTQLTSVANPFGATHVGNNINITSGTGFTTGWYNVRSVSGTTATMDRSVGTAASTGGHGNLGGGWASPGAAMAVAVTSNTVYVKSGTYVLTSTANVAGGRVNISVGGSSANAPFQFIGYNTTRTLVNTDANPPVFQTSTGGYELITTSGLYCRLRNIAFTNPSGTSNINFAIVYLHASYSQAELLNVDWNNKSCFGIYTDVSDTHCFDCVVTRWTTHEAFTSFNTTNSFHNCYAANGAAVAYNNQGQFFYCIAYNNSGISSTGFTPNSGPGANYIGCISDGNGGDGFDLYFDSHAINCISIANAKKGFASVSPSNAPVATLYNCATWNNTGGATDGTFASYSQIGNIALTGNPFTNDAGGDFSLNNTIGAGASCRAAGYPASYFTLATNNFRDIGAAQHQDAGSTIVVKRPLIVR